MNLTERTNAALAWIDKELALCNAATDGPWKVKQIGEHSLTNLRVVSPIGVAISSEEVTVGIAEILVHRTREEMKASKASEEEQANAAFIAAARNGYPAMLESAKNSLLAFREIEEHGFCHCEKAINFILTKIENLK